MLKGVIYHQYIHTKHEHGRALSASDKLPLSQMQERYMRYILKNLISPQLSDTANDQAGYTKQTLGKNIQYFHN